MRGRTWTYTRLVQKQLKSLELMAKHLSFGRVVWGRPTIEFNAGVGRNTCARSKKLLLHALAVNFVTSAGVFCMTRQVSRSISKRRGWGGGWWRCITARIVSWWSAGSWGWLCHSSIRVTLQLALEGVKLLHEVEVGRHIRLTSSHKCESVVQTETFCEHEIRECYRHRL